MSKVRVRFAPSPTGPLHMGGVRTALYNYLFAKKHGGDFLLRIEDTDQNRFVPGAEEYIRNSLQWCGILWDEGPDKDGPFAPYRQSERKELYRQYAMQLIDKGHAYYAFDTAGELEAMRRRLESGKGNPQYDCHTRQHMRNSLSMSKQETDALLESGNSYVIRIRMPENEEVHLNDLIRGEVRVNSSLLDDKVLFKSDGMPTYHLANVVDDYLMKITHVIRGEEWLPSAPLHVMLYRFLGWEEAMPAFAHLPLLLKPDGHGKLSKRDGDRLGFPVFPLQWNDPVSGETSAGYRESGYFPEAFVNLLALLGWNPGTEQELFSMEELTEAFSLERVGKSGAKFDPEKAKWFNHQYMQSKPLPEVAAAFRQQAIQKGIELTAGKAEQIVSLIRERVNFPHELWEQGAFFLQPPSGYDEEFVRKKWREDSGPSLKKLADALEPAADFSEEVLGDSLQQFLQEHGIGAGKIMPAIRLALVGRGMGPDVKSIMAVIGKEETVRRLRQAASLLS